MIWSPLGLENYNKLPLQKLIIQFSRLVTLPETDIAMKIHHFDGIC